MSNRQSESISVRPVQWNRLLDAIELIDGQDRVNIRIFEKYMGVSSAQAQEIARVLHNTGLVERRGSELVVQPPFRDFVRYWEEGDLDKLNQLLQDNYPPYKHFLGFVRAKKRVRIPTKKLKQEEFEQVTQELKKALDPYGLNLGSFNMLHRFAAYLGAVHVSNGYVCFAGNNPSQEEFEKALLEEYNRRKIREGYASMGEVADAVCQRLGMSMLVFDRYFKTFYDSNYKYIRTSSSVMLKPEGKEFVFLQKRGAPKRFSRRRLVDGVNVYQTNIKAFKVVSDGR